MAFLAVIGLRFGENGSQDLAIESGVIWEGSLKAVLSGKAYNSALRLHKCIYEATVRRKINVFEEWLRNHGNNEVLTAFTESTEFRQLLNCPSAESMQQCLDSYDGVANKVYEFEDELRNGAMSSFWESYIEMIQMTSYDQLGLEIGTYIRRLLNLCYPSFMRTTGKTMPDNLLTVGQADSNSKTLIPVFTLSLSKETSVSEDLLAT